MDDKAAEDLRQTLDAMMEVQVMTIGLIAMYGFPIKDDAIMGLEERYLCAKHPEHKRVIALYLEALGYQGDLLPVAP